MSTHQVSYPCRAKNSIAEEFGRHGTWRSNVGWEAIEEPWTNRIVAFAVAGSTAHLFHRNSLTSPLLVQCSAPASRGVVSFMERSYGVVTVSRSEGGSANRDGSNEAL